MIFLNKFYWKMLVFSKIITIIPNDIDKAGKDNHQLHFVGYNFVVSDTSSSTKVRMTTDSFMCTESGLSLNQVIQPAQPPCIF